MSKYPMAFGILLLLSVAFISGCTGTTAFDPNRGVTIMSFTADPSSVNSGELVLFETEIANIGGTTAKNVQIDLYGVEEQWRDSTGSLVSDTRTKTMGSLQPPVPSRNVPGQSRIVQDDLMTPDIRQGIAATVAVEARVSYDYDTNGFVDIPAISEDEYRRRQINNQPIDLPVTVQNSAGPIHMAMDEKFTPIRVDTTNDEEDTTMWPLRIVLTNVGDGFPITPEDDAIIRGAGGKITGTIDLFGPGASFDDCLGETGGTHIDLDSTDIAVRVREDNRASLPCSISIDKNVWGNRPIDSVKLNFNLFYRYYVSMTAPISVSGR